MALRFERSDGQAAEVDEARITKIVWKDDDGAEHEVEGHGFRGGLSDDPDEGHGPRFRREADIDLDKVVRVAWKDEDGTEHDVAGHGFRRGLSDEDDVEGHRYRLR